MSDPREDLSVALEELADFRGTSCYKAFHALLVSVEGVLVEKFSRASADQLLPIQQQYRQVQALRRCIEAQHPAHESPIL